MYVKFNMSPYLLFVSGKNCRIGVNFIDFLFLIFNYCSMLCYPLFCLLFTLIPQTVMADVALG